MSDVQLYLLEYDKNKKEASATAQKSATRLQNHDLKLLELISSLAEYINHEDPATRAKTLSYLSEVLLFLPQKFLSLQQRNLLYDFVSSRISDDTEGLASCAKALLALEERGKWDNEKVDQTMNILLNNTHPLRQYTQNERYQVLRLIDTLMAKYRDALRQLHETTPGFMSRFISYFDGEKDPRNLMVVFSILKVPMTEWDIGADAQELFDAVFNYFPITFRPPPDDPYGITAQDLKDRLRECISSTAYFAPYAFPALLDKLDATSMNTKRDVLQAISSSVREYGPRTIALYSITLWDALKFEILNSQEEDLAEEALTGLAEIARTLTRGTNGPLNAYLRPITKECNEHLEDAPTKQSQASGRILSVITSTSPDVAHVVVSSVLPNIFILHQTSDTIAKRRGLLEVLVQITRADIDLYGEWRSVKAVGDQASTNPLAQFKDQTVEIMSSGLSMAPVQEVSFRLVCLDGLLQLAKVRQLLNDSDIANIIQLLHAIVIKEPCGQSELKAAAINGLVDIAHQKPQSVVDAAFPAFLAELPDTDADGSVMYMPVLEAFAKLASEEKVFDTVILRLKNKLNAVINNQASSTYIVALLSAVLYALSQGSIKLEQNVNATSYYEDIVLPLLRQVSSTETVHRKAFNEERTLDIVGRICNVIIRPLSVEQQNNTIAKETYRLLRDVSEDGIAPIKLTQHNDECRLLLISTHILASLRKEATLPYQKDRLLASLVEFCQQTDLSDIMRATSLEQISLLTNKFIPTAAVKSTMEPLLQPLLDTSNLTTSNIAIIFSLLKGLVLRNSSTLSNIYPSLLSLLSHPAFGKAVAYGFATMLQPSPLLNKANHCQVSGLHKQKTFALLVPHIVSGFREADKEVKTNYLVALSGVLKWMPFDIVVDETAQLTPLLLQSLDLKGEDQVKEAAIITLTSILSQRPQELSSHISSLITRLLNATTSLSDTIGAKTRSRSALTSTTSSNPTSVRTQALVCLGLIPEKLSTEKVLPFKRQVVKKLQLALDDRKRSVRGQAVRCRARWLGVGDEEDD